jgi:hypothetical protein
MSNIRRTDGKVEYELKSQSTELSHPLHRASHRQRKLLRFFDVAFSANISTGAAGWEIATIMANEECREKWRRYLFLTRDFDSDTDSLKPFDKEALQAVEIPQDWSSSDAFRQFRDELVDDILHDESPFDRPQPTVMFARRTFMFTGKFTFGTRNACRDAVMARGGSAPDQKSVSHLVDYLVIGAEGSKTWRRGTYGNKIEEAILSRRDYGSPAIISEGHWVVAFKAINQTGCAS